MERCEQLDLARLARVSTCCSVVVVAAFGWLGESRAAQAPINRDAGIPELFDQERWSEVVRAASETASGNPDIEYYHGVALARLGDLEQANDRLLAGHRLAPWDARFLIELGGVAFKQKRFGDAAQWLRKSIRISPGHAYANDFLGTVYFLQGNLDAALKYWNRAGKPYISDLEVQPGLHLDPVLLDRAFAIAPGSPLLLPDLRTTRTRLTGLGVLTNQSFQLDARADGNFALNFLARERNGWGSSRLEAWLSTLRGLPYQAIHPEYFNLSGGALNVTSMIRWDVQKRRVHATLSSPLRHGAGYRLRVGADAREEQWELRNPSVSPGGLRLRRNAISAGISSFRSGLWFWSSDGELSYRDYDRILGEAALLPSTGLRGYQLKHMLRVNRDFWQLPEHRLQSNVELSLETGRIWSQPSRVFERVQISGEASWKPEMTGDDYAIQMRLQAGKIFGQVPFDELFILGLERDNDLWMRAHIGTREGRKGSAPMGGEYFLSNWDFDKNIYDGGLFVVKLSPFMDIGKIADDWSKLGSRKWLYDTGVQAKLRILGVGFTFTYGKDLRSGRNVFYVMADRR